MIRQNGGCQRQDEHDRAKNGAKKGAHPRNVADTATKARILRKRWFITVRPGIRRTDRGGCDFQMGTLLKMTAHGNQPLSLPSYYTGFARVRQGDSRRFRNFVNLRHHLCNLQRKKRYRNSHIAIQRKKSLDERQKPWYTIFLVCPIPAMSQLPLIVNGRIPL